jgi:hypothetical protein
MIRANEQWGRAFWSLRRMSAASRGPLGRYAGFVRAALILLVGVSFAVSWVSAHTSEVVEAYRPSGVIGVFPPNGHGANLACPGPTATPTLEPMATPTLEPTAAPTREPTATPTLEPTATAEPTVEPTSTLLPTPRPTRRPTRSPEPALIVVSPTPPAAPSPAEGEVVVLLPETGAQRNSPGIGKAVLLCSGSMLFGCGVLYARKRLVQ